MKNIPPLYCSSKILNSLYYIRFHVQLESLSLEIQLKNQTLNQSWFWEIPCSNIVSLLCLFYTLTLKIENFKQTVVYPSILPINWFTKVVFVEQLPYIELYYSDNTNSIVSTFKSIKSISMPILKTQTMSGRIELSRFGFIPPKVLLPEIHSISQPVVFMHFLKSGSLLNVTFNKSIFGVGTLGFISDFKTWKSKFSLNLGGLSFSKRPFLSKNENFLGIFDGFHKSILLVDILGQKIIHKHSVIGSKVLDACFSSDSKLLAISSTYKLEIFSIIDKAVISNFSLRAHTHGNKCLFAITFSSCNQCIIGINRLCQLRFYPLNDSFQHKSHSSHFRCSLDTSNSSLKIYHESDTVYIFSTSKVAAYNLKTQSLYPPIPLDRNSYTLTVPQDFGGLIPHSKHGYCIQNKSGQLCLVFFEKSSLKCIHSISFDSIRTRYPICGCPGDGGFYLSFTERDATTYSPENYLQVAV